jgi:dipeptidyl-peptidase-4
MSETSASILEGSYPALAAMTRDFTAGAPRSFVISAEREEVYFLRGKGLLDPYLNLWALDVSGAAPVERLVVDSAALLGDSSDDVPEVERQRRERLRETSAGITAFSCDDSQRLATFALSGMPYLVNLEGDPLVRRLGADVGVIDPRLDPTGHRVAYVAGSTLSVVDVATGHVMVLAESLDDGHVGLADFVAAEEFDRSRGHWWSPDGTTLAYEVVDESKVETVWLFDPARPTSQPSSRRYPRAGTSNPGVALHLTRLDGSTQVVSWDAEKFPYLVTASWPVRTSADATGPLLTLMSRDQRLQAIVAVNAANGQTDVLLETRDDCFLEWVDGLPTYAPDGRLIVGIADRESDTYRLAFVEAGTVAPFSPVGLQIAGVVGVGESSVLASAKVTSTSLVTAEVSFDGAVRITGEDSAVTRALAGSPEGLTVSASTSLATTSMSFRIDRGGAGSWEVGSFAIGPTAATPPVNPQPRLLVVGPHRLQLAVLFPSVMPRSDERLAIIMSPYGGPHHQRVVGAARAFAMDQYLADQGFCVVVADGRGTGGRGPSWDRSIVGNLGDAPVEDQVAALDAVLGEFGELVDRDRVGIRGWSFGGYLSARCVLTRPDVFHAAVVGAPVTDWQWYDTGYTERYLGHPDQRPDVYEEHSLIPLAPRLERPLFLIHGYNDDNVLFCHTQLLSSALTAAGRPHRVVGLSGVTHMPVDPVIAEHMIQLEIQFFREALGTRREGAGSDSTFDPEVP